MHITRLLLCVVIFTSYTMFCMDHGFVRTRIDASRPSRKKGYVPEGGWLTEKWRQRAFKKTSTTFFDGTQRKRHRTTQECATRALLDSYYKKLVYNAIESREQLKHGPIVSHNDIHMRNRLIKRLTRLSFLSIIDNSSSVI